MIFTLYLLYADSEDEAWPTLEDALARAHYLIEAGYCEVINIRECVSKPMTPQMFVDLVNNVAVWCESEKMIKQVCRSSEVMQ